MNKSNIKTRFPSGIALTKPSCSFQKQITDRNVSSEDEDIINHNFEYDEEDDAKVISEEHNNEYSETDGLYSIHFPEDKSLIRKPKQPHRSLFIHRFEDRKDEPPFKLLLQGTDVELFKDALSNQEGYTKENAMLVIKRLIETKRLRTYKQETRIEKTSQGLKTLCLIKVTGPRIPSNYLARALHFEPDEAVKACELNLLTDLQRFGIISQSTVEFHRDKEILLEPEKKLDPKLLDFLNTDAKIFANKMDELLTIPSDVFELLNFYK